MSYNVKGDVRLTKIYRVWRQAQLRAKQIALINNAINQKLLDFIALQQSIVDTTQGAFSNVASKLSGGKLLGMFNPQHRNQNSYDETSIYYDSFKWKLVTNDPPGKYWKNENDVRLYVIGHFKHIDSDEKLLFASIHFPHAIAGKEHAVN